MKYQSVAWDFDGVLVDSRTEAWRAASEILALFGATVEIQSQDVFRQYFVRDGIVPETETSTLRDMHRLVMRSRAHRLQLFPCVSLVPRLNVPSEIVTSGLASA